MRKAWIEAELPGSMVTNLRLVEHAGRMVRQHGWRAGRGSRTVNALPQAGLPLAEPQIFTRPSVVFVRPESYA